MRRVPPAARLAPPRGTNPAGKDPGVQKIRSGVTAEAAGAEPWTVKAEVAEAEPGTVKVLEAEAEPGTEMVRVSKPGSGPMTWAAALVAFCVTGTVCALRRRS